MNKQLRPILALFFLAFASVSCFLIYPVILRQKGYSYSEIGLIIGSFSITAVLTRLPLSRILSDWKEEHISILGLCITLFSTLLYVPLDGSFETLILVRILHGIGFSAVVLGSFSFVAKAVNEENRYQTFLLIGIVLMACGGVIPFLSEILVQLLSHRALYFASFLFAGLALPFTRGLRQEDFKAPNPNDMTDSDHYMSWRFILLLIVTLLFSHVQATVFNFISLVFDELNLGMGGTYLLIFLAVSIFISVLLYKYPRFGSVKFGYMCIVIGCLLLNLKSLTWGVLVISAFLNGVALAIIYAALNSWASNFGSGRQKSFFMAAFTATYDTGFITGTILSGIFAKYYGLRNLFFLASSIAFFSLVGAIIFLSSRYGGKRA